MAKKDPLKPDLQLLCKLGSIIAHFTEFTTPGKGHEYDLTAARTILDDPDVSDWIKAMGVYLPRAR